MCFFVFYFFTKPECLVDSNVLKRTKCLKEKSRFAIRLACFQVQFTRFFLFRIYSDLTSVTIQHSRLVFFNIV